MTKDTALSDAERQRRRRQKLKAKTEEDKYAPEAFIAAAVCRLYLSGNISVDLLKKIQVAATQNVKATYPRLSIVMQKYAEKRIVDFLTSTEMETEDE